MPKTWLEQLGEAGEQDSYAEELRKLFHTVDEQMIDNDISGTTATVVFMWKVSVQIACVCRSMCMHIFNNSGYFFRLVKSGTCNLPTWAIPLHFCSETEWRCLSPKTTN